MPRIKQISAGLLAYRRDKTVVEVLLAHPGGPFWTKKEDGAWTIPQGLVEPGDRVDILADFTGARYVAVSIVKTA